MRSINTIHRRAKAWTAAGLGAMAAAGALAVSAGLPAASASSAAARHADSFSFKLVPSPGIAACLPHAGGNVTITPGRLNDTMKVSIHGLPAKSEFDLFVIQQPLKPFGVSWYQTDVDAGSNGSGTATVRGVFDRETFSVSPGGTVTFAPTHQFHLGLWFNNPATPFKLGCEPGATTPTVTPFNGNQHAGIQVLNTSQFPVNAGPLSRVHR
ncbi:MAG TPA: hypothetical protein VGF32_28265 [Streptosporangiaceae bacterium]|jgi:hypothetical protein